MTGEALTPVPSRETGHRRYLAAAGAAVGAALTSSGVTVVAVT